MVVVGATQAGVVVVGSGVQAGVVAEEGEEEMISFKVFRRHSKERDGRTSRSDPSSFGGGRGGCKKGGKERKRIEVSFDSSRERREDEILTPRSRSSGSRLGSSSSSSVPPGSVDYKDTRTKARQFSESRAKKRDLRRRPKSRRAKPPDSRTPRP